MKIDLSKITAICIDGRNNISEIYKRYEEILEFMNSNFIFGDIKFFGVADINIPGVKYYKINPFNITEYSRFCIFDLYKHVDTEYCLLFQDDGFIINPELWNDDFLNYDYIGSPWPLYLGWPEYGNQVGNGGFSLRSKKLLDVTKELKDYTSENEDAFIIGSSKDVLKSNNIKIAPLDVARIFSVERSLDENHNLNTSFGFHGKDRLFDALNKIKTV